MSEQQPTPHPRRTNPVVARLASVARREKAALAGAAGAFCSTAPTSHVEGLVQRVALMAASLSGRRLAILLLTGPLLFLGIFFVVGAWFTARGVPPDAVAEQTALLLPHILVAMLVGLGLVVWRLAPGITAEMWRDAFRRSSRAAVVAGVLSGAALAALYLTVLAPALTWLQFYLGDYVPPGEVLATVSANPWAFLLANVLLAPAVEETVYRGVAFHTLSTRYWPAVATLVTCLAFGLLHWPGGMWYMIATGLVAGGVFAALRAYHGMLLTAFIAHLTLNAIEYAYAVTRHA